MIEKNADNLLRLIDEMLDLSKLESGKNTLKVVQANLIEHLRLITYSFLPLAHAKNIKLTFSALEKAITIDFDADKVQQILSNLLSNALKFTPKNGSIHVYVQKKNQVITILVQDDGIGISEEDLPYIFNRFRQAANSDYSGTGIGLSVVKELVNLMDGTISVKSELGIGSSFSIHLPIQQNMPLEEEFVSMIEKGKTVSDDLNNEATSAA